MVKEPTPSIATLTRSLTLFIAVALCPATRDGTITDIRICVFQGRTMCFGMKLANDLLKVICSPHDFIIGWRRAPDFRAAANQQNQGKIHRLTHYDLL